MIINNVQSGAVKLIFSILITWILANTLVYEPNNNGGLQWTWLFATHPK